MPPKISTIIFDLGNVLVDFDHGLAAKRILKLCQKSEEEIFNLFFSSGLTNEFEAGKVSPKEFFSSVKEMLCLEIDFEAFLPIWNEIFYLSSKNRKLYELASKLKGRYKIVMLSNINILHHEFLKKHIPVFDIFDRVFTSYELKAVKPDQEIYKKVLDELKQMPETVFYTDDRIELVESARSLGIRSSHFRSIEQLKRDLSDFGININ